MAISLYDLTAPNFQQGLSALQRVLRKGREHAEAAGIDPDSLVEERLIADMFPLRLQVMRVADHSTGALRDAENGAFTFPKQQNLTYAELEQLVAETLHSLEGWTRERVNALEGRPVVLDTGSSKMNFTAEAFLLSMSIPSFYFHLVTAYDILRMKGVPIGKMDYLVQLRTQLG